MSKGTRLSFSNYGRNPIRDIGDRLGLTLARLLERGGSGHAFSAKSKRPLLVHPAGGFKITARSRQ